MDFTYFIGADVSKNTLDFAVRQGKNLLFHRQIDNKPAAIRALLRELKKLPGFDLGQALFCLEHTGIYSNHLLLCLHQHQAHVCLEAASQIKASLGRLRGKNDKVDALRIAEYAYTHREKLRLWQPKREVVGQLAHLAATRSRLLQAEKSIKTALREQGTFVKKSLARQSAQLCGGTLKALRADLKKVEQAIKAVIASDGELRRLFGLITSVKGVGKVTAAQLLVTPNEFKDISDPKKYACYAGVAPYSHESGLFKGKARVSHLANKKVKTLLHLAALTAVRFSKDLKAFYERKVNGEKKNKMSVLNAVRNKLIHRVFARVNQNRKYEENYQRSLA
ncbi:IS110 family transposase [soil metagenome]